MFIIDAHLDLAYNAIRCGRDLLGPVSDVRAKETRAGRSVETAIVTFPELKAAGVGLVFGTIYVEPVKLSERSELKQLTYSNPEEAHHQAVLQLDYYSSLWDSVDYLRPVRSTAELETIVASHTDGGYPLLGIVLLMEGADPVRFPEEIEYWYERGLRIVGLAWDDTRYSAGAWKAGGGITKEGFQLLEIMADFGMILDLTHMAEEATFQALERYEGPIIASHSNARALVSGQRHLSDQQISALLERDGVIGMVFANPFLKEGVKGSDPKEFVTLQHVFAHIDHICQIAGNARHVGLGSDFDGGFGVEQVPNEIKEVSDLMHLVKVLQEHGYSEEDARGIMGGNWLRLLRQSLPD